MVGCAAGVYLTKKARGSGPRLRAAQLVAPTADWLGPNSSNVRTAELKADKVLALGDLARARASDLLHGPVGNLARERVIALFESAISPQRADAARKT